MSTPTPARRPFGSEPKPLRRRAEHKPAPKRYLDGATDQLRARVAYGVCRAVYHAECPCQRKGAEPCAVMLDAASSAILILDEFKPF